jgi:hypothetical protein
MVLDIDFKRFIKCVKNHRDLQSFFGANAKWIMTYRIDKKILIEENKVEIFLVQSGKGASISSAYIFEKDKNMGRVSLRFKKNPFTKPINIVLGIAAIILLVCMPFSLTNTFISISFGLLWPSLYFLQRKTLCYRVLKNFN